MYTKRAVLLDGDDTLWRTQERYDSAKNQFSALMENAGIRDKNLVTGLDDLDAERVSIRGLTIQRFLESMLIIYARQSEKHELPYRVEIEQTIHHIGSSLLQPPQLYDDALPALQALSRRARLYLYSAGDQRLQRQKVRQLDIASFFDGIFIVPMKDERTLDRIIARTGLSPNKAWMVGNSLRSDILPATNVGVNAILLSRGAWRFDVANGSKKNKNYFSVKTLTEATEIILGRT